jgi:hypothetical protein
MQNDEIWLDIGFTRNPYDYMPLKVNQEDRSIFVGRLKEQRQFKLQVAGTQGGIAIIEGGIGVGKTSFVNAMQYDKVAVAKGGARGQKQSKYLPSYETIELRENVELTDFMLSVLSNCIFSLEKMYGRSASEKDRDLRAGKELVANTVRSGVGFSASILGSGIGATKEVATVAPLSAVLPTVIHTMDRWFDAAAEKFGYEAFLVPINNLDVLSDQVIAAFLNSARDTLLTRHRVWWILIARQGFFSYLETTARRVSELVTGTPILLNPLSLEEVHQAIDVRIERFTMQEKGRPGVAPPAPLEAVDLLYEASCGEIRYVFKRLSDLVYMFRLSFPSERQIPVNVARESLRSLARSRLAELNLTERDKELLGKMSKHRQFRIKDHDAFALDKAQRLQKVVSKFVRLGLIARSEKSKREVLYSTTGDVNLVFRLD